MWRIDPDAVYHNNFSIWLMKSCHISTFERLGMGHNGSDSQNHHSKCKLIEKGASSCPQLLARLHMIQNTFIESVIQYKNLFKTWDDYDEPKEQITSK